MEILGFMIGNLDLIGERAVEHVSVVFVAVAIAVVTGLGFELDGNVITDAQRRYEAKAA